MRTRPPGKRVTYPAPQPCDTQPPLASQHTSTMSLDGQNILDEYISLIRKRAMAWDAYIRYNVVTDADVKAIKAIDTVPAARRAQILQEEPEKYAQLILGDNGVVRKSANVDKIDLVQWVLMWTGDLLEGEFWNVRK